ncbi:MAG: glycosyltransferase family 2 protein [Chloroflexota bacterium]|nr:glycosyltransferase family 2 protein [bacterium]MDE2767565.1 glycosyltransferase family 2 protein [Chloroflexota bacterium]MDE2896746.1 glycosyltransferase family 2 protein [Chloroflexota bacterium]
MTSDYPPVRVVVLNYNGAGRIERCIERLLATRYSDLRVTVVDNASSDGSPARIEQSYPEVELIENGANLGFSRGNNRALREADEPYVGLLNPDTEVEPGWLEPLVTRLNGDPIAGGVGAKLLHQHDRIPVRLTTATFEPPPPDRRRLGVQLFGAETTAGLAEVTGGAHGVELNVSGQAFRWTDGCTALAVPVDRASTWLRLDVAAGDGRAKVPITVHAGDHLLGEVPIGSDRTTVQLDFKAELVAGLARPAIECAGIAPLDDGSMRDRGTQLLAGVPWSAWDSPGFSQAREIFAPKGAAVLYRRSMLDALDYLDDGIFMYYEDADLAWRARRRGWRFWYEPSSVVRHEHAALSREWSPGFVRNVEFGKLRMLGKNAPWAWVAQHAAAAVKFGAGDARRGLGMRNAEAARLAFARLLALTSAATVGSRTWQCRRREARLAPLDGRELHPFIEML